MSWRTFLGALLIVCGAGFFLDQLDIIDFGALLSVWWPMILVIIGAIQLITRSTPLPVGAFLILLGALMQLNRLELVEANLWSFVWPGVIVLVGLYLLFTRSRIGAEVQSTDRVESFAIFGGHNQRIETMAFKGGSAIALFGGTELDLRDCRLDPGGATLDLTAAFGGIEVAVPQDWKVHMTGLPLFGGWDNKTRRPSEMAPDQPVLNVRCLAAFGGIEVHN